MELRITTKMEPGTLPEIQWNSSELKEEIQKKAQEYATIAYTDSQTAEMRKDRATLNRLVKAFEEERKQVKKFYAAPYEKFEAQVKEVLEPVRSAVKVIDDGLYEIEQKYRSKKTEKMREYYDLYVGDLRSVIPFEKTVKESMYKKSITDKHLETAYHSLFNRMSEEMEALEELPERFRDKAVLKYIENYSLSEALREGKRLEEMEKALEERKRKAAEEKAKKEEASRKAVQQEETSATAENKEDSKAEVPKTTAETQEAENTTEVQEEIWTLDFRVRGTKKQIMDLREYLIRNNIQFGKVE